MTHRPSPFRRNGRGPSSPGPLFRFSQGDVVCADALACLSALPNNSVDILFLDPPFNLGKRYGMAKRSADRLQEDAYFAYMWQILMRGSEVLRPGGALFLYHVPRWAVRFSAVLQGSLSFRHWIAISMKNGFVRGRQLYPAHYALLYYSKGPPKSFSRPKIPAATCPHCGKLVKDYGGYRRFVLDGVNLSDIWDDLSPVRHRKNKHREENELPVRIPERVVQIAGRRGGLFVDPFAGTGSSLLVAIAGGMRFLGCDREKAHFDLIAQRVAERLKERGSPP